jgi:hypothetical protein
LPPIFYVPRLRVFHDIGDNWVAGSYVFEVPGREDDWQTRRRANGSLRLANRCVTLVSTIPAENPESEGTRSAMYKPDWIDPELGESVEEGDEQEAIQEGMF